MYFSIKDKTKIKNTKMLKTNTNSRNLEKNNSHYVIFLLFIKKNLNYIKFVWLKWKIFWVRLIIKNVTIFINTLLQPVTEISGFINSVRCGKVKLFFCFPQPKIYWCQVSIAKWPLYWSAMSYPFIRKTVIQNFCT